MKTIKLIFDILFLVFLAGILYVGYSLWDWFGVLLVLAMYSWAIFRFVKYRNSIIDKFVESTLYDE